MVDVALAVVDGGNSRNTGRRLLVLGYEISGDQTCSFPCS